MKKTLLLFLITVTIVTAQDPIYHDINVDFKPGEAFALFGNDVKFRGSPDVTSKVIDLLKIGSEVQILEKTDKIIPYNGINSPFYKVKYKGQVGYILGGLISLEKKQTETVTYVFAYKKEEFQYHLLVRAIDMKNNFIEQVSILGTPSFSVELSNNKGLKGVDYILHVNNHPEACGVVGGDIYFFQTENGFKKAIETTVFSEAGINWYTEKLVFPTEDNGVENRVLFKKEQGEYGDEASNEIHISSSSRELRWENGELLPKITEKK